MRIRRLSIRVALSALSFGVLCFAMTPALAHDCCGWDGYYYYYYYWQAPTGPNVNWRFTEEFPAAGTMDDRVVDGAHLTWNVLPSDFDRVHLSGDYGNFNEDTCPSTRPYQKNGIHWKNISPALGYVQACLWDGDSDGDFELHDTQMVLDSVPPAGTSWYSGTGVPGANQFDAWSVAAHEFGHMGGHNQRLDDIDHDSGGGMGHWREENALCPDAYPDLTWRETMCPATPLGWYFGYNLAEHEIHNFMGRYP